MDPCCHRALIGMFAGRVAKFMWQVRHTIGCLVACSDVGGARAGLVPVRHVLLSHVVAQPRRLHPHTGSVLIVVVAVGFRCVANVRNRHNRGNTFAIRR
jgi:hypothetical protein